MDNAIYLRRVTNVPEIHFQFKEFLNAFRGQSKAGAFGKMVNKCVDFRKVYRANKEFHIVYPRRKRENSYLYENDYKDLCDKSQENWHKIKQILKMLEALVEIGLTANSYVFIVVVL